MPLISKAGSVLCRSHPQRDEACDALDVDAARHYMKFLLILCK